jgi:hypothetical protein
MADCDTGAGLTVAAKNVNGKVVKRDLKPSLVDAWAKRKTQVKAKL